MIPKCIPITLKRFHWTCSKWWTAPLLLLHCERPLTFITHDSKMMMTSSHCAGSSSWWPSRTTQGRLSSPKISSFPSVGKKIFHTQQKGSFLARTVKQCWCPLSFLWDSSHILHQPWWDTGCRNYYYKTGNNKYILIILDPLNFGESNWAFCTFNILLVMIKVSSQLVGILDKESFQKLSSIRKNKK